MRLWYHIINIANEKISQYEIGTLVEYHGYVRGSDEEKFYKDRIFRIVEIDAPCLKAEPVEECYINGIRFYWTKSHCAYFRKIEQ